MRNQDLVSQKAPIVRFIGLTFHTSYGNLWKKLLTDLLRCKFRVNWNCRLQHPLQWVCCRVDNVGMTGGSAVGLYVSAADHQQNGHKQHYKYKLLAAWSFLKSKLMIYDSLFHRLVIENIKLIQYSPSFLSKRSRTNWSRYIIICYTNSKLEIFSVISFSSKIVNLSWLNFQLQPITISRLRCSTQLSC